MANEDIKGFKCNCPSPIIPMAEWVKGTSPKGNCRPCLISPVAQWYVDELKERGQPEHSASLAKIIEEKADPSAVCQKFDEIKSAVDEDLRERLKEFDCEIQVNDAEGKL